MVTATKHYCPWNNADLNPIGVPELGNLCPETGKPLDFYSRYDVDDGDMVFGLSLLVRYGAPMERSLGMAEDPTEPYSVECWVEGSPVPTGSSYRDGAWRLCKDLGQPTFYEMLDHLGEEHC